MQQTYWPYALIGLFLLVGPSALQAEAGVNASGASAGAATSSEWNHARGNRGGFGFAAMLNKTVGLTPEQTDSVKGLLAEQRQQSVALREQTDQKIRALLTPEQRKKFDAMLAHQKEARRSRSSDRT